MARQKPAPTLVTFLVDTVGWSTGLSGSGQGETGSREGLETWRGVLLHSKADVRVSLVLADRIGGVGVCWPEVARPTAELQPMTEGSRRQRTAKALVDLACEAILATEARIASRQEAPGKTAGGMRVVVAFQFAAGRADEVRASETGASETGAICGDDSPARYGWNDLRALIRRKRAAGWEFVLLGAGIDVYDLCRRIGIGPERALSHGADRPANLLALSAAAHNMAAFANGVSVDLRFSTAQKMAAGDAHDMPGYAEDPLGLPRLRRQAFGSRWSGNWTERLQMRLDHVSPQAMAPVDVGTEVEESVDKTGFRKVCFEEIL